jgi:YidC/Oxa1 family membrane protein insertase
MRWFAPLPPPVVHPGTRTAETGPESGQPPAGVPDTGNSLLKQRLASVESLRIENSKMAVTFSDVGGKVNSIQLKDYTETIQPNSPGISTVRPTFSPESLGTFFNVKSLEPLDGATYQRSASDRQVDFKTDLNGIEVQKNYELSADNYFLSEKIRLKLPSTEARDWGYLMIPVGAESVQYDAKIPLSSWEAVAYQNESVTRKNWEKIPSEPLVAQGNTGWVAFGNRYFATALINRSTINPDVVFSKSPLITGVYLRYPIVPKPGEDTVDYSVDIYSGPKDSAALSQVPGLKRLIDYGTFSFFAYPLLDLLRFFYRFVHNYGVAIILLTLVVRILFYPLSVKSFKSMRAMQKLQPQLTALKEKYKDDAQRFGQEQMALFKAHKVNPAGGCLPMLVQLPVFIALYAVLGNSIELFHAPFFGWIQDLSARDPFYIFPVLMGISMFLQQRMTPAAGMDPTQQKIMHLMPVVFSFIMFNLPSGLTIYIFLSTILGVLQQYINNRESVPATGLVTSPQGGTK